MRFVLVTSLCWRLGFWLCQGRLRASVNSRPGVTPLPRVGFLGPSPEVGVQRGLPALDGCSSSVFPPVWPPNLPSTHSPVGLVLRQALWLACLCAWLDANVEPRALHCPRSLWVAAWARTHTRARAHTLTLISGWTPRTWALPKLTCSQNMKLQQDKTT